MFPFFFKCINHTIVFKVPKFLFLLSEFFFCIYCNQFYYYRPTKYGTIGPGFCNKTRPFNPEALYGIENQLEQLWTPIEKHKKITALWSHEWLKHGTCAAVVPKLSTEFQYFNQGLEWMKDYNMYSVLEKAGVTPGSQYNITKIWDGVQNVLGKNPQVACYQDVSFSRGMSFIGH